MRPLLLAMLQFQRFGSFGRLPRHGHQSQSGTRDISDWQPSPSPVITEPPPCLISPSPLSMAPPSLPWSSPVHPNQGPPPSLPTSSTSTLLLPPPGPITREEDTRDTSLADPDTAEDGSLSEGAERASVDEGIISTGHGTTEASRHGDPLQQTHAGIENSLNNYAGGNQLQLSAAAVVGTVGGVITALAVLVWGLLRWRRRRRRAVSKVTLRRAPRQHNVR